MATGGALVTAACAPGSYPVTVDGQVGEDAFNARGNINVGSSTRSDVLTPTDVKEQLRSIQALKYDEHGCDVRKIDECLAPGQNELVAQIIRRAQEQILTADTDDKAQQIMAGTIVEIQQMAAQAEARIIEGNKTLEIPKLAQGGRWVVWASNKDGLTGPADMALPLPYGHRGHGEIFVWGRPTGYENSVPDPNLYTFSGDNADFWAVAVA